MSSVTLLSQYGLLLELPPFLGLSGPHSNPLSFCINTEINYKGVDWPWSSWKDDTEYWLSLIRLSSYQLTGSSVQLYFSFSIPLPHCSGFCCSLLRDAVAGCSASPAASCVRNEDYLFMEQNTTVGILSVVAVT